MTSLDSIKRLVNSDVTEGVITTRSNRLKFRLECTWDSEFPSFLIPWLVELSVKILTVIAS